MVIQTGLVYMDFKKTIDKLMENIVVNNSTTK